MSKIPKKPIEDLTLENILDKYSDTFLNEHNLAVIKRSAWKSSSLYINFAYNTPPAIFAKPTVFPNSIIKEVNNELRRLEKLGLITKISSSEWGTPIGFKRKENGEIHLYGKYDKTINKFIKPYPYHGNHESLEKKINKLKCGKKFSVLDLSAFYTCLRLPDNYNKFCNWNTHYGIYQVNYLQTELSMCKMTVETIFNHMILWDYKQLHTTLSDKCVCKNSKIIVTGKSHIEHLKALQELFLRISRHGYLVNREKSKFLIDTIKLSNFVISKHQVTMLDAVDQDVKIKNGKNKPPASTKKQFNEFIRDSMEISEMTLNNRYDD